MHTLHPWNGETWKKPPTAALLLKRVSRKQGCGEKRAVFLSPSSASTIKVCNRGAHPPSLCTRTHALTDLAQTRPQIPACAQPTHAPYCIRVPDAIVVVVVSNGDGDVDG